jgi:hypothetical protein
LNLSIFGNYLFCGSTNGRIYKYIINEDKLEFKGEIMRANINDIYYLIKLNKKTIAFTQKEKIYIYHLNEI